MGRNAQLRGVVSYIAVPNILALIEQADKLLYEYNGVLRYLMQVRFDTGA